MEKGNNGTKKCLNPLFHHSRFPFFFSACSAISAVNVFVVNVFGGEEIEENSFGE
jgi:hypothetical protein